MANVIKREQSRVKEATSSVIAKQVFNQLLPDFPATSLEFIKRNEWQGPMEVSLDDIDFAHRSTWTASHEPKKVQLHQELIEKGESDPIILAKLPGNDKLVCLDAHHRLLSYEALGRNPVAYVGHIRPADVEAALTMHASQYHGGSKLNGTEGKVELPQDSQ